MFFVVVFEMDFFFKFSLASWHGDELKKVTLK